MAEIYKSKKELIKAALKVVFDSFLNALDRMDDSTFVNGLKVDVECKGVKIIIEFEDK